MTITLEAPATVDVDSAGKITSHAGAAFFCQELQSRVSGGVDRLLVAGCGAGHEAACIQRALDCEVDAVDLELYADDELQAIDGLHFDVASVTDLPFADESFDAVFYHHVIEHVDDPAKSLAEIHRVLRPGGWLFVGTPNRHRLASAVGAHRQTDWESTLSNKLRENWQDWHARLRGRFRNEFGEHAGFAERELDQMLARHFPRRQWLTANYLRFKYGESRWGFMLPFITARPLVNFVPPGIYVLAQK